MPTILDESKSGDFSGKETQTSTHIILSEAELMVAMMGRPFGSL